MTKNIGIVLGVYAVIAFAVFLLQWMSKLEDGMTTGNAFSAAIGAGVIWPVSLISMLLG